MIEQQFENHLLTVVNDCDFDSLPQPDFIISFDNDEFLRECFSLQNNLFDHFNSFGHTISRRSALSKRKNSKNTSKK